MAGYLLNRPCKSEKIFETVSQVCSKPNGTQTSSMAQNFCPYQHIPCRLESRGLLNIMDITPIKTITRIFVKFPSILLLASAQFINK